MNKPYKKLQSEYYKRFPSELKLENEGGTCDYHARNGGYEVPCDCDPVQKPLSLAMILRMMPEPGDYSIQASGQVMYMDENGYWWEYKDLVLDLSLDPKDYPEETLLEICNLLDI